MVGIIRTSDANQRLLRRFLSRYNNLKKSKKRLEERLQEIEEDFIKSPLKAVSNEGGSKSAGSKVPPYIIAVDDILTEMMALKNEAAEALKDIMGILNLLDHAGIRYTALCLRYIDGWGEEQICDYIPCARSTYYRIIDDGIKELLDMEEVHKKINRFAIEVTKIPNLKS